MMRIWPLCNSLWMSSLEKENICSEMGINPVPGSWLVSALSLCHKPRHRLWVRLTDYQNPPKITKCNLHVAFQNITKCLNCDPRHIFRGKILSWSRPQKYFEAKFSFWEQGLSNSMDQKIKRGLKIPRSVICVLIKLYETRHKRVKMIGL